MSVNDRLERIENKIDKIIDSQETNHVSVAEAHEAIRWMKIIGSALMSLLGGHAAWEHLRK